MGRGHVAEAGQYSERWLASLGAHAAELVGRVVGFSDGDTITVLDAQLVPQRCEPE